MFDNKKQKLNYKLKVINLIINYKTINFIINLITN